MSKLSELTKGDVRRKHILFYTIMIIAFILVALLVPEDVNDFGPISALPAAFLIIYIFATKRIIEALALATILTTIMGFKGDFFGVFNEIIIVTLMSEDMSWLIVVCGLMGGIVAVIETSGGLCLWKLGDEKSKDLKVYHAMDGRLLSSSIHRRLSQCIDDRLCYDTGQ